MGDDLHQQFPRRNTRSSSMVVNNTSELTRLIDFPPPSVSDLLYGKPITMDVFLSTFPAREPQILELLRLLGPLDCPMLPIFLYGGPSTGKTSIVLHLFRHLNRPFIYSSCRTCYSPRILFESILNQALLHRRDVENGYTAAKRCEKPSDFVSCLKEVVTGLTNNLASLTKKSANDFLDTGSMIYLIFDNVECVRDWNKSANILSFFFNLYDFLRMPEVGIIFISNTSLDTYYSPTGYTEPVSVHFPDYTEDDLRRIFMRNQSNSKLHGSFIDVVLRPFCRATRRFDELDTAFTSLYSKYCEPLSNIKVTPSEELKRMLFSHIQPHVVSSLNEIFSIQCQLSFEQDRSVEKSNWRGNLKKNAGFDASNDIDFHMSVSVKYLLISAFLASRNPATLDAALFDSTGGSENRKRKRKNSAKSTGKKEIAAEEALLKGPGTFPLERLLAIFQCITSVIDGEWEGSEGLENDNIDSRLMSDVLLQLSSLFNANFITKGGNCLLDGTTRFRCTVSEDVALKVARSLKFPLTKYLYRG